MKNYNIFILISLIFGFSGCLGCLNEDVWHSSLQDKVCGANPQTSTKIREEFVVSTGGWEMRFNTADKVYLFHYSGITLVNAFTKEITEVVIPNNNERDYVVGGYALSSTNEAAMGGFYNNGNNTGKNVLFFINTSFNITDIIPAEYAEGDRRFRPFFYNGFLYCAVYTWDFKLNDYLIYNMLKFSLSPSIMLIEDNSIDVFWASAKLSQDNLIWSYNSNTRSDPSKIIFSFDGTNYNYYGPGVAQNGPNGSFAIDSSNIFIGYYSGVVWQYDSGAWKKHAITKEDEAGYSVGEVWASSKNNVFIAGSTDVLSEQNFAYHYDGACWTRWYKHDGYRNIDHIWGTPDGSVVLALDDSGNLYRLWVEE